MSTRRSTAASRQHAAPDDSLPPFAPARSVPANQRFNRRPASGTAQLAFSAAANHSDGEEAEEPTSRKQTAKRPNSAISSATASSTARKKPTTTAAQTKRQAKKSGPPVAAAERESDGESEAEESAEKAARQPKKQATQKRQAAARTAAPAVISKQGVAAAKPCNSQAAAAADDEDADGQKEQTAAPSQRKGRAAVVQPKQKAKPAPADVKKPGANLHPKRATVSTRSSSGKRVEAGERHTSQEGEAVESKLTKGRPSKPTLKDEETDDLSAVALLQAFNGGVELPSIDEVAVAKKGRERQARAEEDNKAAAPSRGRRPAKHVGSGVDATSELNYNAEQTDSKSTRSMVAPRRGKSAEQKTAEVEETEQFAEQQEQTASRRTSETEERAAGAVNKATGETGPAEAETVETVLEALRDKVLLISATPEMTQQYEAIAKSLGARVVRRFSKAVSHVVWDDGSRELLERVEDMAYDEKPFLVSREWLNATAENNAAAFEIAYPINRNELTEQDDQQHTIEEGRAAADNQQTTDSGRASSQQQMADMEHKYDGSGSGSQEIELAAQPADADIEAPQPVMDDGTTNTAAEEAAQHQGDTEMKAELQEEELKLGWRKKKNKSEWADTDTTTSLTEYEQDREAEDRKRLAVEKAKDIEDDVNMLPPDDPSNWVDEDGEELKRERKKAGRRYLRERERAEKILQQPPINHNHRNEPVGMVRFEPNTFDESAIADRSERHALLSPLTDEDEQSSGTESGSSSEFECTDDDNDSGGEPSSSSSDEGYSKLVDDRYDDRQAQRRRERRNKAKKRPTKVVKGASRSKRVQPSKRDSWDSDEEEELMEEEEAYEPVRTSRRRPSAPAHRAASATPQKKVSASLKHAVAAYPPPTQQDTIAFSAFTAREKDSLSDTARHLRGFTLQQGDDDTASHVVVDSSKRTRTRKVLFGIARGSWVIDRQWLLEYRGPTGQLLDVGADGMVEPVRDEDRYWPACWPGAKQSRLLREHGGRPLVFDGERVFVAERTALARPLVEQLIYLVGGRPATNYFDSALCLCADDFVVADLGGGKQLVGLPSSAFPIDIVTTEWLYDCITEGGLKSLDGYKRYTHPDEVDEDEQLGEEEAGSPAL